MAFAAVIDLNTLNGSNGGVIVNAPDYNSFGTSVSAVGDINGDGYADFVVGARGWSSYPDHSSVEGAAYVVFGTAGGLPANFNVSSLSGHNGFALYGDKPGGQLGWDVAGIGDVNGDGFDDLVVSAHMTDNFSGTAYVIYGRDAAASGDFLAAYTAADVGSALPGSTINSTGRIVLGESVAAIGDINHDGYADFTVGALALGGGIGNSATGGALVIYGGPGALPASITEADLDGTLGFRLLGAAIGDYAGRTIGAAGDINGDGIDDLIIGAQNATDGGTGAGAAFVLFGRDAANQGAFAATVSLADLDGTNGFRIDGGPRDTTGKAVSSIGDINGDGFDDLAVTANDGPDAGYDGSGKGGVYIIYGRNTAVSGAFNAQISTGDINGALGFHIEGITPGDYIGASVAGLGDINGDGVDDFIIGADTTKPDDQFYAGSAYVVFGSRTGFAGGVDLATLNGSNGFTLKGTILVGRAGKDVHAAGDLNGDGIGDILVGAPYASTAGHTGDGVAYIIYGQGAGPITQTGGAGVDVLTGAGGADTLNGGAGKDTLNGLGGDDTLNGDDGNDVIYGGDGNDVVHGGEGGDIIYAGIGGDNLDGGGGNDKLFGDAGDDIIIGAAGNDSMFGGDDNDTLTGNSGNDQLNGGTGADIMTGGADNDVYIVDNIGDQTIELADEGYDIVRSDISWTLDANIEGLQLQGAADIDGAGNELANNMQGNAGSNRLDGGAGVDNINGNDGDDFIIGGLGNDLLTGGGGADTFIVAHAFGPTVEVDRVYDFDTAAGDVIDLSGAYAGILSLVSGFTKQAGEMTLSFSAGTTLLRLDIDGDGKADYQMRINGDVTGDSGGWLL